MYVQIYYKHAIEMFIIYSIRILRQQIKQLYSTTQAGKFITEQDNFSELECN